MFPENVSNVRRSAQQEPVAPLPQKIESDALEMGSVDAIEVEVGYRPLQPMAHVHCRPLWRICATNNHIFVWINCHPLSVNQQCWQLAHTSSTFFGISTFCILCEFLRSPFKLSFFQRLVSLVILCTRASDMCINKDKQLINIIIYLCVRTWFILILSRLVCSFVVSFQLAVLLKILDKIIIHFFAIAIASWVA